MARRIQLRTAAEDDIPRIEEWAQAIDAGQFMSRYLPDPSQTVLWRIVIVEGVEAGTAWVERKPSIPDAVFLGILIGQSELLGVGIGCTVVREIITVVRAIAGNVSIRLNVRTSNTRAIACYAKCGFVQIASGEMISSDGALISTMTMQLSSSARSAGSESTTQPIFLEVSDTLNTERLTIRCPRAGDGQKVFEATIDSLDALRKFPSSLPWAIATPSIDASEAFCRNGNADFAGRRDFPFLMVLRHTETVIGCGGIHRPVWSIPAFDIGWWGRTPFLGRGLISEGVNALLRFAFSDLRAARVQAIVDESNEKSWRLCERVGMSFEGKQRHTSIEPDGQLRNSKIYACVR